MKNKKEKTNSCNAKEMVDADSDSLFPNADICSIYNWDAYYKSKGIIPAILKTEIKLTNFKTKNNMKAVKCEVSNYQNKIWLFYADKREVKMGDRVIKNGSLQKVNHIYNSFDMQGFYGTTGASEAHGGSPEIVIATEEEVAPSDLEKIKNLKYCNVYENDGVVLFKDGFVVIEF